MRQLVLQRGMTLIELMVSMVIGLFLLLGAVTVYTEGRQNYQISEGIARVQENLRFAMDIMEPDIRLAGYWGLHNVGANVANAAVNVTCDGNDVTAWALDTDIGIRAENNIAAGESGEVAAGCPAFGAGIQLDTDVLEIRRASSAPQALTAGIVQVESDREFGTIFSNGARPGGYLGPAAALNASNTFNVVVNTWYVSRDSDTQPGVPSLRRRALLNGVMVDEELISGVENMQIQFGIDTNADGTVDRYVDPEAPVLGVSQIISAHVWLLMRSEIEESGFQDGATYTPPDAVLADITPADGFRRMEFSKTIFLRNFNRQVL